MREKIDPLVESYYTEEYAKFVIAMAEACQCQPPYDRPCDGVLAGGLCDRLGKDPEFHYRVNEDED